MHSCIFPKRHQNHHFGHECFYVAYCDGNNLFGKQKEACYKHRHTIYSLSLSDHKPSLFAKYNQRMQKRSLR